jgi:succinoglycan biosynthesis protein ExoL
MRQSASARTTEDAMDADSGGVPMPRTAAADDGRPDDGRPDDGRKDKELVFFCPDVTDAPSLKRVQQFLDHDYRVTVFGFRRDRFNSDYEPAWPHVMLGTTVDGRYGQRLRALLGAIPVVFAYRRIFKCATAFYARNVDQLLLALFARLVSGRRIPVTYEVLDIPPILMRRGFAAAFVRAIERFCLRRIQMLVLSSPGFHRGYYSAIQNYRGDWFLLENKLHPSIARTGNKAPPPAPNPRKWVIGYFGLIRGDATFELMTRLAKRLGDQVEFRFRGVLTTVTQAAFDEGLRRCPNITYGGPYVPYQDLEAIYGEVDFAWALDLEHTDHNSRWLLPCRFYEAGYFGVPCLAVRGFEVGSLVERHRIGWTFDEPLEEVLVRFFERLSRPDYDQVRRRLRTVPRSMFVAGADVSQLCARLERAA